MGVKISMTYLLKQQKLGKIKGFKETSAAPAIVTGKQGWKTKGINTMREVLDRLGVEYKTEYEFDEDKKRKFRFDFCIVGHKVAAEYEGISSKKSRHTTKTGFTRDTVKYTMAAVQGWRVLRYTSKTLPQFEKDLKQILNGKAD